MDNAVDLFNVLFQNTSIYGYIGILILITIGLYVTKKVKVSFVFWVIVLLIMGVDYANTLQATGYFSLHAFFCFFGAVMILWSGVKD